jgi:hypothetical protein
VHVCLCPLHGAAATHQGRERERTTRASAGRCAPHDGARRTQGGQQRL